MSGHSRERACERYNLELTKGDERAVLGYINAGQCIQLALRSKKENTAICYVKFKKIPMKVVYLMDLKQKAYQIITILPFDADEFNRVVQEEMEKDIENNIKFLKSKGYIVYKRRLRTEC